MRQFDVCRVVLRVRGRSERLVIVLQHDFLGDLKTRIVAPLLGLNESAPVAHLAPEIEFEGRPYRISFHKMTAIETRDLEFVGHLAVHDLMMRANDLIFAGV